MKSRKRDESCLSLPHPFFNPLRPPYSVFTNKGRICRPVDVLARFSGGPVRRLVGGTEGTLDRLQRTDKCFGSKAGCLLGDVAGDVCIVGTNKYIAHDKPLEKEKTRGEGRSVRTFWTRCTCRSQVNPISRHRCRSPFRGQFWIAQSAEVRGPVFSPLGVE